jgi:hypothetical protein
MSEEDYKSVGEIKNQWVETKDEYLDMALNVIDNLKIKNKQLKEVIEEVREHIEETCYYPEFENYSNMTADEVKELLQILDKAGDIDEKKN